MEHKETLSGGSVTVDGVTIEVDVELSAYLHTGGSDQPGQARKRISRRGSGRRQNHPWSQIGAIVRVEPVQIRLVTGESTVTVDLR